MHNWSLQKKCGALRKRARIIQSIRSFFIEGGYLEVETPLRIPAPAPESHIDAIPTADWFLHTSPELCMKRLLAAGYDRIFQICHCWREAERGVRHLPEFTMLEWYRSGSDYRDLMEDCENLFRSIANDAGTGERLEDNTQLSPSWERLSVRNAFARYAPMSMEDALQRDEFDDCMVRDIEPHLGRGLPTFLYDYPAERSALSRLKPEDPSVAERFELYIAGVELANGFSELTDAEEQRRRFADETAYRAAHSRSVYPVPEKFLEELPAMPPSAGIALGVDRLVMVMLGCTTIDDVVAFPPETL